MSMYSGKCDCYDTLVMIHNYSDEELKNNVSIYVGDSDEPLKIDSQRDLIPYYAHLISSAYFDGENKKAVIHLTSESHIDIEEREKLHLYLSWILKIYNRCKRNKAEFDVDEAVYEVCANRWNRKAVEEIAIRVKENGKKARIDGIHLEMQEYYRMELVEVMVKNGLNPADYGYGKFVGQNSGGT